jgi:hypothetical protein
MTRARLVRRRWRQEAFSLAAVFVLPLALTALFPFEALRRRPPAPVDADEPFHERMGVLHVGAAPGAPKPSFCAFVELTAAEEAERLAAARALWQTAAARRREGPDLFAVELPAAPARPIIGFTPSPPARPAPVRYTPLEPPTDWRAAAPAVLPAPPPETPLPAFSKTDLLTLD